MHVSGAGANLPVAIKPQAPNPQNVSPAGGDNEAIEPQGVSEAQEGEGGKGAVVNVKA